MPVSLTCSPWVAFAGTAASADTATVATVPGLSAESRPPSPRAGGVAGAMAVLGVVGSLPPAGLSPGSTGNGKGRAGGAWREGEASRAWGVGGREVGLAGAAVHSDARGLPEKLAVARSRGSSPRPSPRYSFRRSSTEEGEVPRAGGGAAAAEGEGSGAPLGKCCGDEGCCADGDWREEAEGLEIARRRAGEPEPELESAAVPEARLRVTSRCAGSSRRCSRMGVVGREVGFASGGF